MSSGIVICRLCAESKHISKQVDLISDMEKRDEVIKDLSRLNFIIDFNDEKLPNTVCCDCICILNKCCDFVDSVESAQIVLHDLFYKRIPTRIELTDDEIFFENAGLDDCDFCDSECGSIESQDAATPHTDDDLNSIADLVPCNPDSSLGLIPSSSESNTLEAPSDEFFLSLGLNPIPSIGLKEPIASNPEVKFHGIQSGDSGLNHSKPRVKEPDGIIPVLASNQEPSVSSVISIADSDELNLIEGLGSNKTDTNDSGKPSEAQSDDIPVKALKSKYLNPGVSSGEPKEKKSKTNTSKTIASKTKTSKTKISKTETSKTKISKTETSKTKTSNTETSKTKTSNTETSKTKTFNTETSKTKTSNTETSKTKTSKIETPKKISLPDVNFPAEQIKTWKEYNWLCTFCETVFPTIDELCTHSLEVHSICNPYRCTNCKLRHQCLDPFLDHITKHMKQLRLTCFKCAAKFKDRDEAKEHVKVHLTKLSCPGCYTTFKNSKELKTHEKAYLQMKYYQDRKNPMIAEDGMTCAICSKTYTSKTALYKHLQTHERTKREYVCDICGKDYFEKNHLTYHMGTHTDDRPFKCKVCNRGFRRRNVLKEHVWMHNDKPFPCTKCDKTFKLEKLLKLHQAVHSDVLPFECEVCHKRFRVKCTLTRHMRTHTGERPFQCKFCKQTFRNRSNLTQHTMDIHNTNIAKQRNSDTVETKAAKKWKTEMMERKLPKRT